MCIFIDISSLGAIKRALPEDVTYGEIKMTIAIMMVTTGFVRPASSNISTPSTSSPVSSVRGYSQKWDVQDCSQDSMPEPFFPLDLVGHMDVLRFTPLLSL